MASAKRSEDRRVVKQLAVKQSKSKAPKARWTVPTLIDLDYLLQRDDVDPPDAEFFREEIRPHVEDSRLDRPDHATMSRALWIWLGHLRERFAEEPLPGRMLSQALRLVSPIFFILSALVGAGLVAGMLHYDGRTFNVLLLFGATLGVQFLFLGLALLTWLFWGAWRKHPFLTLTQRLAQASTEKLTTRMLKGPALDWWKESKATRRLLAWPALRITQTAGIGFNVGAILALTGCVLFLSIRFVWESTTAVAMQEFLVQSTAILSSPWQWAFPQWVPSAEQITAVQYSVMNGVPEDVPGGTWESWYSFFLAALVIWGLVPRILLRLFFGLQERRMLKNYSFLERSHREWWRVLTDIPVERPTKGPADDAWALLWGGFQPDAKELRTATLQVLRSNIRETFSVGGANLNLDDEALEALKQRDEGELRVILVAEAWALAPADFRDFHEKLRTTLGNDVPIDIFLTGLPAGARLMTAPKEDEVQVWQKFAADLDDPALYVRPWRSLTD